MSAEFDAIARAGYLTVRNTREAGGDLSLPPWEDSPVHQEQARQALRAALRQSRDTLADDALWLFWPMTMIAERFAPPEWFQTQE